MPYASFFVFSLNNKFLYYTLDPRASTSLLFLEILIKKQQGCKEVILSRLFQTSYKYKEGFLGVVRFNLLNAYYQNKLIPLGGIRLANLNKLKILNSHALVLFSEIKKKPAIIDRLF